MLASINSVANENASKHNSIEEIIVSGLLPEPIHRLASSASLITAEDIARSGANSLPELLSQLANVTLKSYSGNAKSSSIDIRGSGATSVSNVLVLVDGVKMNASDLSGVDFSLINLQHIEHIEVIRGGNTVRYGSGASHGIINIITRNKNTENARLIQVSAGQHDDYRITTSIQKSDYKQHFSIDASIAESAGYRQHNQLDQQDLLFNYRTRLNTHDQFNFNSRLHRDTFEHPGALSPSAIDNGSIDRKTGSVVAGSEGKTRDDAQLFNYQKHLHPQLLLSGRLHFRERENHYIFGETLKQTAKANRDRIEQRTLATELLLQWHSQNEQVFIFSGIIDENNDYSRSQGGQDIENSNHYLGKLTSEAEFISFRLKPSDKIMFDIGYRHDRSENQFKHQQLIADEQSNQCDTYLIESAIGNYPNKINCPLIKSDRTIAKHLWRNEALEFRSLFALNHQLNAYFSLSKTFRNPNVDELILSAPDLSPQTADRYETGIKFYGERLNIDVGFFDFKTHHEILFRSGIEHGVNFNAMGLIKRTGAELQGRIFIDSNMDFTVDLGYTDVVTEDDKRIPLVPFWTSSIGANWQIKPSTHLSISANYTGQRFDGNDFNNNSFPVIDSHTIFNATLHVQYKLVSSENIGLYISINNLFNADYYDIAYSHTVYPAPLRTIMGGVSIEL
ncbi:MAG: hypothetical protein CL691_02040 [Cellvibrionales bacterium]|nr:hypothetical protein [Cellvibrionales bacterium]|tara:strand:+ start:25156 stop:27189 length:2034 start_codon:yes stop_codon:yes gene_type:complete